MAADIAQLVTASFERIEPELDQMVGRFYEILFERHPEVRPMFSVDIAPQRQKLAGTLRVAVASLGRLDELVVALRAMGRRHAKYGVRAEHFDYVGDALLTALSETDEQGFTDETRQAWASVYGLLAKTMLEGMNANDSETEAA